MKKLKEIIEEVINESIPANKKITSDEFAALFNEDSSFYSFIEEMRIKGIENNPVNWLKLYLKHIMYYKAW